MFTLLSSFAYFFCMENMARIPIRVGDGYCFFHLSRTTSVSDGWYTWVTVTQHTKFKFTARSLCTSPKGLSVIRSVDSMTISWCQKQTDTTLLRYVTWCSNISPVRQLQYYVYTYTPISRVYLSVRVQDAALAATRLSSCITDIAAWMSSSRLRLNPSKTGDLAGF